MSSGRSIQVQIPAVERQYDSLRTKIAVFKVHVFDHTLNHVVELDDPEIAYLHEQLRQASPDTPELPKPKWALFESVGSMEERRRIYEKYFNDILSCPSCVSSGMLWATLAIPPAAAISHRFLIRGDNIIQLEELSAWSEHIPRFGSAGMVSTLCRVIYDRCRDRSVVSSGTTVLLRLFSRPENFRLLTECSVVPNCVRAIFQGSLDERNIRIISEAACSLVTAHPQTLFWYFQRDGGLTELMELLDSPDTGSYKSAVLGLAEVIWTGVTLSKDVELAIADKSSVGIALLNKLLMKGQGTETELIITSTLAYLFVRGQVPEYGEKICKIIPTVISESLDYRLRFTDTFFPRFLHLLGKPETPVIHEFEQVIRLACFLLVTKCMQDPTYFDRTQLRMHLTKRLRQIVFTGSEISETTRGKCAEALVILGGPDLENHENLSQALEMEKYVYSLNSGVISEKIQKLNNFFIEANFDLSSRHIADPIGADQASVLCTFTDQIDDLVKEIDADQMQLQLIHTKALNEVVSGMFQVKSLMKEIEGVGTSTDLSSEPAVEEIEKNAAELKRIESEVAELRKTPSEENAGKIQELAAKATELKVSIVESAPARELHAKRSGILKTFRTVNMQVMKLNSDTFASLVEAVKVIDEKSVSTAVLVGKLKTVLIKMKRHIDDLLEELDAEAGGSSPVSP